MTLGETEEETDMKVEECMTTTVFSCRSETTLEQAARLMWEHDCGVLPVIDDQDRVIALVTDRDVCMGAYTQGKTLAEVPVANSMSRTVVSCHPQDAIEQAIRAMADQRVRRVPVVDASGKLQGMLSLNDVFRQVVAVREPRLRSNLSAKLAEAMAAICERHGAHDVLVPTPARARPIESGTVART
jgi:CBS-domain-containing membrane protein